MKKDDGKIANSLYTETGELNIPEGVKKDAKPHRFRILSPAIFLENLKSNYVAWSVTSIGNAILIVLVILIMSTLSINATKDAMNNLFSNAHTESEIKTSAIAEYLGYSEGLEYFEGDGKTAADQASNIYGLTSGIYDLLGDDQIVNDKFNELEGVYDVAYKYAIGSDSQKQSVAKVAVLSAYDLYAETSSGLTDSQKAVGHNIVGNYFNLYPESKDLPNIDILENDQVIPQAVYDYVASQEEYTQAMASAMETQAKESIVDFNDGVGESASAIARGSDTVAALAQTGYSDPAKDFGTALLTSYYDDPVSFDNNTVSSGEQIGYRDNALIGAIVDAVKADVEEMAYWQELPTFAVPYLTNELGEPVYYVRTTDSKGDVVTTEVVITTYDTSKLIPIAKDMQLTSNLLEKQHKKELTGVDYTDSEKADANTKAAADASEASAKVQTFLEKHAVSKDEDGSSPYYDSSTDSVNTDAVLSYVAADLEKEATEQLLEEFGETSLANITKDKYDIDGQATIETINGYVYGSVASFGAYYQSGISQGWDDSTALFYSLVNSTTGQTDLLPEKSLTGLEELGTMNTYGIIVGHIFFGLAGLLLPIVYTIVTANSLIAEKVESGSLAFTLSTPVKRTTVVFSDMAYMLYAETAMYLVLALGSIIARAVGIATGSTDLISSLPIAMLLEYIFGSYMVMIAVSGICFCASAIFNKTRYSMGVGGGIPIFSLVAAIMGLFGSEAMPSTIRIDAMGYFNYVSIMSLFDAEAVTDGNLALFFYKLLGLLAIAVLAYGTGIFVFDKKDLPL